MFILAPSILAANFNILGEQLNQISEAGAQYAHIDVMDGHFVPNISFGLPLVESIRKSSRLVFDVHLMISEPEKYIRRFAEAGADIINFHIEATGKNASPTEIINEIHRLSKKAALTISPNTSPEIVFPYLKDIEMLLIMSVEPGFGGQRFIPGSLEKARVLKKYITEHNLQTDIEMDGGISINNVSSVIESGVNIIVAGSAIFDNKNGVFEAVKNFIHKFNEHNNIVI